MKGYRFSIAWLMAAVVFIAIGLTAFRSGSEVWFQSLYTIEVCLLFLSTLVARFSKSSASAFWFGVSAFGWCFFLLGFGLSNRSELGLDGFATQELVNNHLLTTRLIKTTIVAVSPFSDIDEIGKYGFSVGICHVVLTFVLAPIAGWIAVIISKRGLCRDNSSPSISSAPIDCAASSGKLLGIAAIAALFTVGTGYLYAVDNIAYFPNVAFSMDERREHVLSRLFSVYLGAAREPPIWDRAQFRGDSEVYRFLRLGVRKPAICMRAEKTGASMTLRVVVLDGLREDSPGVAAIDRTVKVSPRQWDAIVQLVKDAGFWSMGKERMSGPDTFAVKDLVEGASQGRYHVVQRNTFSRYEFSHLFEYLLELSGIRVQAVEVDEWG